MNIDQIRYFLEIANCKKISQAAENLYISQSSLNASITKLEDELGYKLFTRSKKGMELTDDGKEILKQAETIMEYIYGWKRLGKDNAEDNPTRVLAPPIIRSMVVNDVVSKTYELYGMKSAIYTEEGHHIVDILSNYSNGLVINPCEIYSMNKVKEKVRELNMVCDVVYCDCGFFYVNGDANIPNEITLPEMKCFDLVCYSPGSIRNLFEEISGSFPRKIMLASSSDQWEMIKKNKNVAGIFTNLISIQNKNDLLQGKIKRASIKDVDCTINWLFVYPSQRRQTPEQKIIIELIKQKFDEIPRI